MFIERSVSNWGTFVEQAFTGRTDLADRDRASKDGDVEFRGATFTGAHALAKSGWVEGAQRARRFTDALVNVIGSRIERHDVVYDVEGRQLEIPRLLSGEPECWMDFEPIVVDGPNPRLLRVIVNLSVASGIGAPIIETRGAVIAALIELLEMVGHRVELTALHNTLGYEGDARYEFRTVVKPFDQPLDMPLIAFAVGHPAMPRIALRALAEQFPRDVRRVFHIGAGGGYGRPHDTEGDRGDVYVPAMKFDQTWWSDTSGAEQWMLGHLATLGVALKESSAT